MHAYGQHLAYVTWKNPLGVKTGPLWPQILWFNGRANNYQWGLDLLRWSLFHCAHCCAALNCSIVRSQNGQTALSIAESLGIEPVVELLKNITDVIVSPALKKRKLNMAIPESMQEAPMSDWEDEGQCRLSGVTIVMNVILHSLRFNREQILVNTHTHTHAVSRIRSQPYNRFNFSRNDKHFRQSSFSYIRLCEKFFSFCF